MAHGKKVPAAQRLLILADALASSAPDAAQRWGVSEHAIWTWAARLGGLRGLREIYETKQIGALSEMARAISVEVRRRLPAMSVEHVLELALETIRANKDKSAPPGATIINAPMAEARQERHDEGDRVAAIVGVLAEAGLLQAPRPDGTKDNALLPPPSDA